MYPYEPFHVNKHARLVENNSVQVICYSVYQEQNSYDGQILINTHIKQKHMKTKQN